MAIHNREAFLNRLASNLGRECRIEGVQRPTWSKEPQKKVLKDLTQDELIAVLKKQCEVIHTTFYETSKEDLHDCLREVIRDYNGERIITSTDSRHGLYGNDSFFEELVQEGKDIHYWDKTIGHENQVIAEKADIGITFSDMTLAESGTVALFNNADHGRSVSLLPQTYIALIPKSTLVPRITQVAAELHKKSRDGDSVGSCISLVTGPSNSADIEMKLIVGVHGPVKATYIVIHD